MENSAVINHSGHDDPDEAIHFDRLGGESLRSYQETGEIAHLDESIKLARQAVEASSESDRAVYLNVLGYRLKERFEREGDVQDLAESIQITQDAVNANCDLSRRLLNDLHISLGSQGERTGAVEDSERIQSVCSSDESQARCQDSPSPYQGRLSRAVDLADLESTVKAGHQPFKHATPKKRPGWITYLNTLGLRYRSRVEELEEMDDMEGDIKIAEQEDSACISAEATHPEDPFATEVENSQNKGNSLFLLLQRLGSPLAMTFEKISDAEPRRQSIQLEQDVWDTSPDDTPDLARFSGNLAARLGYYSESTAGVDDLEQAIELQRRILEATPYDHPSRPDHLLSLSDHLHYRYQTLGTMEDLELAIEITQEAVNSGLPNDPDRPANLCALSRRIRDRYVRTEAVEDIQESVQLARQAVDLIHSDHPDRPICLNELSIGLETRFLRTGSLTDLETAIQTSQEALVTTPANHPIHAELLESLSSQLTHRFEQVGALVDLQEAIHLMQKVVQMTPVDHPCRVSFLHTLGCQFGSQFKRTDNIVDLERAIQIERQAAALVRYDDPVRVSILNSLSLHLGARSAKTASTTDLDEAIRIGRKALRLIRYRHPDRNILLHNLSCRLKDRFQTTHETSDLAEAVRIGCEAVDSAPQDHPNRAMYLNDLAILLRDHCPQTGVPIPDNRPPIELFIEALNQHNAPPLDRIMAGQNAFSCYVAEEKWTDARSVAKAVVQLLPWLVPRWLSRNDQQHLIKNMTSFSSLAASAVLQAGGSPAEAIETLEAGRGVTAGLAIDLRSDVSELQEVDPLLFSEYTQLRRQILLPLSTDLDLGQSADSITMDQRTPGRLNMRALKTNFSNATSKRAEIMQKLEEMERKIRKIPGFEQFRIPPSSADFVALARDGPIIAFIVTEHRSDALIVTQSDVISILLDELRLDDLKRNVIRLVGKNRLSRGKPSTKAQRNQELRMIMQWLWEVAVQPVLCRLGLNNNPEPGHPLPRIWWVASGFMGLLPMHAAGDAQKTTMDYVVSSYTPTLKALKFSREKQQLLSHHPCLKMLIVPVPQTVGKSDLKTDEEIESIKKGIGHVASCTVLDRPSKADVLFEMAKYQMIHFACHGSPDSTNPSDGALLLAPGPDREPERLSVRELAATLSHEEALIAYLSACSTAENSAPELIDEIIHVASAFQLIGFPHVVGTLWEASDKVAIEVARLFYEAIGQHLQNCSLISNGDIASSLHEAIQQFRRNRRVIKSKDVLSWAPFIHMGA